jgi:hypothetical protein
LTRNNGNRDAMNATLTKALIALIPAGFLFGGSVTLS